MLNAYNDVMRRSVAGDTVEISAATLKDLNTRILKNLDVADHVVPGEYRDVSVVRAVVRVPRRTSSISSIDCASG